MNKTALAILFLLLLFAGEAEAQKSKSQPGIACGEMPALDWRDLKEFGKSPFKWWASSMAANFYFNYERRRNVDFLNLVTRENAYNAGDLGLVITASEEVKNILDQIPFLSTDKIESWSLTDLDIPVPERVVKGMAFRMEIFRADLGPFRGIIRAHNGMHGERLTLKEIFGLKENTGIAAASAKLITGQRGYPLGGEAIIGLDVLQLVFGGRKFRIETKGKNPISFSTSAEVGYGMAFDLSNVYKLPQDWSLIEETIEQSIVELTPWDSQLERELSKVAADLIIKDLSVPKSLTSSVLETNLSMMLKMNLKPKGEGKALRYRQFGVYSSMGKSFYNPSGDNGAPNYSISYIGGGVFWNTFF
ncbi:MAG: hypothetical protein WA004_07825 [Saprospiraceae bacterium]